MRRDLEQKLVERWPSWFNVNGDPLETRMADGFAHGDGWFNIVWRLCEDLEPLVAEVEKATGRPFEVLQVKEKLGNLRFYVSHRKDAILQRIEIAESESLRICEVCGKPGSCGTTAFGRRAMSTPACDPSAVYPISVNFAEAASIGCSPHEHQNRSFIEFKKTPRRHEI